ncbi:hypothetical protein ABT095_37970 [Kitasatospora sp. NPDC002227]|uniref:hypothetical protein n=1 Tax=Kitasatospora sp. NPDC002227 TaxID=3154773 RepID=UPI0033301FC0
MTDQTTSRETFGVTVHLIDQDGRWGEALAQGILLAARTVVVPHPPERLRDPWNQLGVQIARYADDGSRDILRQKITVSGLSLRALEVDGTVTTSAQLNLSQEIDYPEVVFTRDEFVRQLTDTKGDLWATYSNLGYPIHRSGQLGPGDEGLAAPYAMGVTEYSDGQCCNSGPRLPCCVMGT